MRIGITGATGFLGSHLAPALVVTGHYVIGLGRNLKKGRRLAKQGVHFISVDLSDLSGLKKAFQGLDLVVHSAALSSVWGAHSHFNEINVVGTKNVIEACKFSGIRKLIYVSSSSVYFDYRDRFDILEISETADPAPSLYSYSKIKAEIAIQGTEALDWIILRPRGIFGPGDSSIIPRVLRIVQKGWFPMVRQGKIMVDLTYVGNVVQFLELCLHAKSNAWNQLYNVSNGEPVQIVDFLDQLMEGLELSPKKLNVPTWLMKLTAAVLQSTATVLRLPEPPLTRYTAGLLCHHQTLNISKSRKLLGYVPEISIEEGIKLTLKYLKSKDEWQ